MKNQLFAFALVLILVVAPLAAQNRTIQRTLLYDTDKATLTDDHLQVLQAMFDSLGTATNYTWEITGHTDADATYGYNQRLSEARALGVQQYLLSRNIAASTIKRQFLGETKPVAKNTNEAGKQQNRRVEVVLHYTPAALLAPVTLQSIQSLFDMLVPGGQTFTIVANKDTLLRSAQGTIIAYKANSLATANGQPETGEVVLKLTEIYQYSDMLMANLSTTSNSKILSTRGMFTVEASKDGQGLTLSNPLMLMVPSNEPLNNDVQLFTGDRLHDSVMDWIAIQNTRNGLMGGIGGDGITECDNIMGQVKKCPFFWCKLKLAFTPKSKRPAASNPAPSPNPRMLGEGIVIDCNQLDSLLKAYNVENIAGLKDVMLQEQYKKYNVTNYQDYISAINREKTQQLETKYESGTFSGMDLSYYLVLAGELNTNYNCDIFARYQPNELAEVKALLPVGIDKDVKLLLPMQRILLPMARTADGYTIKAPKGTKAYIVAMGVADNQPYLHIQKITIGEQQDYTVELRPYSLEALKTELKKLDLAGV